MFVWYRSDGQVPRPEHRGGPLQSCQDEGKPTMAKLSWKGRFYHSFLIFVPVFPFFKGARYSAIFCLFTHIEDKNVWTITNISKQMQYRNLNHPTYGRRVFPCLQSRFSGERCKVDVQLWLPCHCWRSGLVHKCQLQCKIQIFLQVSAAMWN